MARSSENFIIPEFEVEINFGRRSDIAIYDIDSNFIYGIFSNNQMIKVPYNRVYYKPQLTCSWFGIKEDHEVEVHYRDELSGLPAWQSGIVKFVTGSKYLVELTGVFAEYCMDVVETVENFQIRPINHTSCLKRDDLTKMVIQIPEPCQEYLKTDLENFGTLKKFLKAFVIRRISFCELLIISDDSDFLEITDRLCDVYFEYVLKRSDLYKTYKFLESKMQMINDIKSIEVFSVSKEIISFAMGKANKNLHKAEQLAGVIYIRYIQEKETFEVHGSTADSVKQARLLLEYSKTTFNFSNPIFIKYFGDGFLLAELATSSSIITSIRDSENNTTVIDLIGEVANVQSFIKFIRLHFEDYKEIFTARNEHFLIKEFDAFKLKMRNKATMLTDSTTKKKGKRVFPTKKRIGQFKKQDPKRKKKAKPKSKKPPLRKQHVKLQTPEKKMKFEDTTSEDQKTLLEEPAIKPVAAIDEASQVEYIPSEGQFNELEEQISFYEAHLLKFCESPECDASPTGQPKHKVTKSRKLRTKLYTISKSQENIVANISDDDEIQPTNRSAEDQLECEKLRRKINMVLSFPLLASRLETRFRTGVNRLPRFDLLEPVVEVDEDSQPQPHQNSNDEDAQKDQDNPRDTEKKSKKSRLRSRIERRRLMQQQQQQPQ